MNQSQLKLFVNLPVRDLSNSMKFYERLGFKSNPQFTDDTGACMILSDSIYIMLLTHSKWSSFTKKAIPDARETAQIMLAFSHESRSEVDHCCETADKFGGKSDPNPPQDHGFMYGRSFEDPDGHIWEPFWMDAKALG